MKLISYEVVQRSESEHRPGHLSFLIDGIQSEITTDPAQFMPKAIKERLAAGDDVATATVNAQEICEQYAARSIARRIARLQAGLLPSGPGVSGGPVGDALSDQRRGTEAQAVELFLNRGSLRGLDKSQRIARHKRKAEKRDHEAAWREQRIKLVAQCEADLKGWEAELAKGNRKAEKQVRKLRARLRALTAPILAATHGFQYAYGQYATKQVDLVNDDIRFIHCMTNTTVDTERDAKDAISDFTTLDNFDGSGTAANGHALDSQAVNIDDANDRAEFDAADEVISALGAGTRSIDGILVFSWITNLNSSLPLHWLEYSSDKTPDGSDFTVQWNAEGIIQFSDG